MTTSEYKNKILKAEPKHEVLSRISYEAFKDKNISMKQYDKIVEMGCKREFGMKI